jgi:hypothetical protein
VEEAAVALGNDGKCNDREVGSWQMADGGLVDGWEGLELYSNGTLLQARQRSGRRRRRNDGSTKIQWSVRYLFMRGGRRMNPP